jgi:putative SOS response-associated peptidase YedK
VVTADEDKRELTPMRWRLVPRWWSKLLKELRVATFNARALILDFLSIAI